MTTPYTSPFRPFVNTLRNIFGYDDDPVSETPGQGDQNSGRAGQEKEDEPEKSEKNPSIASLEIREQMAGLQGSKIRLNIEQKKRLQGDNSKSEILESESFRKDRMRGESGMIDEKPGRVFERGGSDQRHFEEIGPMAFALDRSSSHLGRTEFLCLAENLVTAAVSTFKAAGAAENVKVTEVYDCEAKEVLNFTDEVSDFESDILTEDGRARGSSPLSDVIELSAHSEATDPETIVVLTHGTPDRPSKMMKTINEVDAEVVFVGVGELQFIDGINIEGSSRHIGTITSKEDIPSILEVLIGA